MGTFAIQTIGADLKVGSSNTYVASMNVIGLATHASTLYAVTGFNSGPDQFVQVFDSGGPVPDGTASIIGVWVPSMSNFSIDFGQAGLPMPNGISVSNSSTNPTKTGGAADCQFLVSYR